MTQHKMAFHSFPWILLTLGVVFVNAEFEKLIHGIEPVASSRSSDNRQPIIPKPKPNLNALLHTLSKADGASYGVGNSVFVDARTLDRAGVRRPNGVPLHFVPPSSGGRGRPSSSAPKEDEERSVPTLRRGIETIDAPEEENHNTHSHSFAHSHTGTDAGHHHAADNHNGLGGEDEMRADRSPDEPTLCTFCLCNEAMTKIYCLGSKERKTLVLESALVPESTLYLSVTQFDEVVVMPETFAKDGLFLKELEFDEIANLTLLEHAFHFTEFSSQSNIEVFIKILNCYLPIIPSSTMTQEKHSNEGHLRFGMRDLGPENTRFISLEMCTSTIGELKENAFHDAKMFIFNITDIKVDRVEANAIDLTIQDEFIFADSKLPRLPTKSMHIIAKKNVIFARNYMKQLDPYAWSIVAEGQVQFNFNKVELIKGFAFADIKPDPGSEVGDIVFVNNTVLSDEANSLVTSDEYPRHRRNVVDNKFGIVCNCNITIAFRQMLDIQENMTYDEIMHKKVMENSLCLREEEDHRYRPISSYYEEECAEADTLEIIIAALVVAVLLVILSVTVAIVCANKAKRVQEEMSYLGECSSRRSYPTLSTHQGPLSPIFCADKNVYYDSSGNPSWIMGVPEVKTYTETEVNVPYEESRSIRNSMRTSVFDADNTNPMRQSRAFN